MVLKKNFENIPDEKKMADFYKRNNFPTLLIKLISGKDFIIAGIKIHYINDKIRQENLIQRLNVINFIKL
jgi:hypothetical protein